MRRPLVVPLPATALVMPETPAPGIETLVANHRRFLEFLERRVGSRADAEDILQSAFVRGLEHAGDLRDAESTVAWFYRVLRNALTDHYRSRAATERALGGLARESDDAVRDEPLWNEACRCVTDLLPTLKPEYASLLRRVDIDGLPVAGAAREANITANNASVRLHRAREALLREVRRSCRTCADHGCLDCTCGARV